MPEPLESHVDLAVLPQEERLARMRHSAAHVLAEAMLELMPEAELGIGPPIDTGFYYDFRLPRPLTQEDLTWLEERMRASIKRQHAFQMAAITRAEAEDALAPAALQTRPPQGHRGRQHHPVHARRLH